VMLVSTLRAANVACHISIEGDCLGPSHCKKSVHRNCNAATAHQLGRRALRSRVSGRAKCRTCRQDSFFDVAIFDSSDTQLVGNIPVKTFNCAVRLRMVKSWSRV
jgi:hypothetical protein